MKKQTWIIIGVILWILGATTSLWIHLFTPQKEMSDRVSVYEDQENGVSCYILDEKVLSCLPNQFLKQSKDE